MEKQISFQGVSLNPYGDISPDGELSACVNLQSHGGALRPSVLEGTEYQVGDNNLKLITIHATSDYRHMILYDGTSLYWADEQSKVLDCKDITTINNLKSVHAIGNTLSVLSDDGITYILFKNNEYITLGDIPEVSLAFALKGAGSFSDATTVAVETIPYQDINKDFSDNNKRIITDAAMSLVNEYVTEQHEKGNFIFPFVLRYALRLYNNDLIRHSVPILISCTNKESLYPLSSFERDRDITELGIQVIGCYFQLYFKSNAEFSVFENWSDIIRSIDIFISEPIYTYYPDKLCEKFSFISSSSYAICSVSNDSSAYIKRSFEEIFTSNNSGFEFRRPISLPYKNTDEIAKSIEDTSNFYLLTSISLRELSNTFVKVNIDSTALSNISFKQRMTDDYDSHDKLYPSTAFVYNKRLNIANIKKEIFKGHQLYSVLTYQDDLKDGYAVCRCYIFSRINNKDVVSKMPNVIVSSDITIDYFFFPSIYAYKAVFVKNNTTLTLELKNHPLLNGVYYCSKFQQNSFVSGTSPTEAGDRFIYLPNVIYTSQVDNPFYFPVEGVNTVGTGEILGLSTITTALSQGQYGYFPLMVFCTDGNYALEVNSEGLFSKASAMQRDVCTNPASITQTDGAIVFVSAKGVMLANGSAIQCISAALDGVYDDLSFVDSSRVKSIDITPPVEYFQDCMIAYDYSGKRLLFMKPSSTVMQYGWQYDIDNIKWQQVDFAGAMQVINVYPYSYIQQSGVSGNVIKKLELPYNYSDVGNSVSGVLVTRPLKLDTLQLKFISQIRLEGNFTKLQRLWLYGSNNLRDWFFIAATSNKRMTLRGRYFKFFRIVITTELANNENISGCRIVFMVKPEYRLR